MTQFNTPTYQVQRATGKCAITGRELEPGEPYMATLIEVDPESVERTEAESADKSNDDASAANDLGMRRLDICMEAWNHNPPPPPDGIFCYWKTVVPEPTEKRRLFVDDAVLLNLFRRLEDDEQPKRQAFRFVLGLILMRKRLLKYEGSERVKGDDGTDVDWWLVKAKGEEDPIRVLNPRLGDDEVQQVTEQLSEVLDGEL